MFYFARAAPSIDLHAEQLVERMRWTWWTPFYVYPIRLLLISRTACFHLARLSLLLTSTHLSCVRLPTARFRRDRIKTFFFFLFSLHFLRQRAIKWKYFFFLIFYLTVRYCFLPPALSSSSHSFSICPLDEWHQRTAVYTNQGWETLLQLTVRASRVTRDSYPEQFVLFLSRFFFLASNFRDSRQQQSTRVQKRP